MKSFLLSGLFFEKLLYFSMNLIKRKNILPIYGKIFS
ncbi:diacylglycerol kinase catalytic region, partial [Listeria ivanovii FSL F6-596]